MLNSCAGGMEQSESARVQWAVVARGFSFGGWHVKAPSDERRPGGKGQGKCPWEQTGAEHRTERSWQVAMALQIPLDLE